MTGPLGSKTPLGPGRAAVRRALLGNKRTRVEGSAAVGNEHRSKFTKPGLYARRARRRGRDKAARAARRLNRGR